MTIMEKSKIEKEYYELARNWKTDFVMSQFRLMWDCQRELESELHRNGFDVAFIARQVEFYRLRRSALVKVLKERGVC